MAASPAAATVAKAAGAALCRDFPCARLITLSRPGAINSMTVPMTRDLHRLYLEEPHPNPDAVYVLRGDGAKAFCAGGDITALNDPDQPNYRNDFHGTEYTVDGAIAAMSRPQVALWRGHVLGSGVGVSIHGRYRVACETTRLAMPETKIGAPPVVGTAWLFGRMRMAALGAYLAITGESIRGADVYHSGLATHYVPIADMTAVEEALLNVRAAAEVAPLLDAAMAAAPVPPFSLEAEMPTIEKAFTIGPDTTVGDITAALEEAGTPFARATLETLHFNSPLATVVALESVKIQSRRFGPGEVAKALAMDRQLVVHPLCKKDFVVGARALLIDRTPGRPKWSPATFEEVDAAAISTELNRIASSV